MNYTFIDYAKSKVDIPKIQEDAFLSLINFKKIKKGENFISEGEFSKSIAYVKKGLFRYYYINEKGFEFTKKFVPENSIMSAYGAYLKNIKSYLTIQALEDSEIEVLDLKSFESLTQEHSSWNNFLIKVLQEITLSKEKRAREFLMNSAPERYFSFLNSFPDLEKRVKQHIIASYIGISAESLSRIRRKMIY